MQYVPPKSAKSKPRPRIATVGLCMVVHNHASILPRVAAAMEGQVDYWTIFDAGSTDGSMEVAWSLLTAIPGQVIPDEERSYSEARNRAMTASILHSAWVLLLDPEEAIAGNIPSRTPEKCNCIEVRVREGDEMKWQQRLFAVDDQWRWEGDENGRLTHGERPILGARSTSVIIER